MKTEEKSQKTQGVKMAATDEKTEERNPSLSYTIKSLGGNIQKLQKLKVLTQEEIETLVTIRKKLIEKYIGLDLNL